MAGFIFGEGTPWDYKTVQSKRQLAERLAAANARAPRNVGEGLSALGRALAYRQISKRADRRSGELQSEFDQQFQALFGGGPAVSTSGGGQYAAMGANGGPTNDAAAAMSGGLPASLVETESGGNWGALNNEMGAGGRGHGGRGQFGHARLKDAASAGIIPEMTPQEFAQQPPQVQMAVENWHIQDIDRQIADRGLDKYFGQEVGGVPITRDGLRAMAHLGGIGGAEQFLTTGGRYNPSDSFGTSLSDYGLRHAGGGAAPTGQGDLSRAAQLAQLMSNPMATDGQRALLGALMQQSMPMSPLQRIQMQTAQAQLDQMQNPTPDPTFRDLTDEEEAQLGLDPSGVYQRSPEGAIKEVVGPQNAQSPTFRPATPEEAAQYGAEAGQIDTSTGRFYAGAARSEPLVSIGGNQSPYGDPPTGTTWVFDENGDHVMEQSPNGEMRPKTVPFAGSAAEERLQRQEQADRQNTARAGTRGRVGGTAVDEMNFLLEGLGYDAESGEFGDSQIAGPRVRASIGAGEDQSKFGRMVWGGTDTIDFLNTLQSLQDTIAIDRLLEIKEAGSGLGQVPQSQLRALARAMGNLDAESSDELLRNNILRAKTIYEDVVRQSLEDVNDPTFRTLIEGVAPGAEVFQGSQGEPAAPQSGGSAQGQSGDNAIPPNPTTGTEVEMADTEWQALWADMTPEERALFVRGEQ